MYCPNCHCEFVDWIKKCPNCKSILIKDLSLNSDSGGESIPYGALVDLIRKNKGSLKIELSTTKVVMQKKWFFPHFGFGYAWAKRMHGTYMDIQVELSTHDVGKGRQMRFPYLGYGFAWANSIQGTIGGNEVSLSAQNVSREKKWGFPYFGFGRAWTQEMGGECGEQLKAELSITDKGRSREWGRFPFLFRGYGFAWEKRGTLTLVLNE
jgi:hypothetical protein